MSLLLIEINIQIRAVEAVAAVGTGDLAVLFVHLAPAAVADVNVFFFSLVLSPLDGF